MALLPERRRPISPMACWHGPQGLSPARSWGVTSRIPSVRAAFVSRRSRDLDITAARVLRPAGRPTVSRPGTWAMFSKVSRGRRSTQGP